jgi:aspartate dehydrogenase
MLRRLAAPGQAPAGADRGEGRPAISTTRVAIAGLGAIGRVLAKRMAEVPGLELACVAARDAAKAQAWLDAQRLSCPVVPLSELPRHADLAVECAPAAVLDRICRPMLEAGKRVVVLSAGALLLRPELIELARARGGQIVVPTGALLGLDAVTAAAEGTIHAVRMTTRKPPQGLVGAPYLVANGISVEGLNAPKRVFSGTAREAAAGFPANVNVAAALSLAGIGPDRTMIEIWADPGVARNCHSIEVESDSARFTLAIENIPSENPKTGRITALSVLAALRKLHAPLRVGT